MTKMGGANLISFTIDGIQYQAEEGMTWGEWIESEYNTTSLTINEDFNTVDAGKGMSLWEDEYVGVYSDDIVISNHEYYIM